MKRLKKTLPRKSNMISRRHFLSQTATAATLTLVPRPVLGGHTAPSEKVNVAIIGTGGQGIVNMKQYSAISAVRSGAMWCPRSFIHLVIRSVAFIPVRRSTAAH